MNTNEIVWSRKAAIRNVGYRELSEAQQNTLADGIMKWGAAHRHHAVLATESGEPAGSGVCVTSGGRRGILTARHVLYGSGENEVRLPNPVIGFAPSQGYMVEHQRRLRNVRSNSGGPIGPFPLVGITVGERVIVLPLQRNNKAYPDPGLPDIAIVVLSDDIEERLRVAARAKETATPEPQWVDLDTEDLVDIPYDVTTGHDEMLTGSWLITGLRGERSDVKKMYCETDAIVIDRIYKRSEYEYYGIFVDEVGGRRNRSRGWKGTSGGGVWQQRLTRSGQRKIAQFSPPDLTPEDLEPPVLGGIAFFHEVRKSSQELKGESDGKAHYRGELYAHRISGMLLGLIRQTLRQGFEKTEMRECETAGEATRQ